MDLVERVKAILLTPKSEWLVIERESGDPAYLFTNYVAILAAIPAVCGFIGFSLIGIGTFRVGFMAGLVSAIVQYLLAFVMVYVLGLIIDALAPTFEGQKNPPNALKLAVYSMTPGWLAGVFLLIPALGFLGILGFYGLYLLWLGLPPLMKSPEEKAIGYTAAIAICAVIIFMVIRLVVGLII
jgi:Yip1 domain